MHILVVNVKVKPEHLDAFIEATRENARHSLQEPGVARFDLIQQQDDPTQFLLYEVYRTADDPARHKETDHYKKWAEVAVDMMDGPRTRAFFTNIEPGDEGFG